MAAANEVHIRSEILLQQLGGCKFIAEANRDELNKDPLLKELIAFKMEIAQGFIEELQGWEVLGNQSKCQYASENAQFFLGQIQVIMDRMLDDLCEKAWLDFQKELRFGIYVPNPHVLDKNTKNLAQAA